MSYTAPNQLLMPMRHSIDTALDSWMPSNTQPTALAWPTANLAIYVPLRIPSRVTVRKLWFGSGTTGTGNVDMALYDAAGTAVISATATTKIAATSEQVFDVTDTVVGPGRYYIALSSDSATDDFYVWSPAAPNSAAYGVLVETSAYPLPATATWAISQTLARVPLMGVLTVSTVA